MNAMTNASKKILIADDDASIRLVLSQAFTRLGYQVRATGNAGDIAFGDRAAVLCPLDFRVGTEITDQNDFIDASRH